MSKKGRPVSAFVVVLIFSFILYYTMLALQPLLKTNIFDYDTWLTNAVDSPFYRFLWLMGDSTEPHFHKTVFGGIGVLIGSIIAYILDKKESKHKGFPISYGTGKWPYIFTASFISLSISVLLFGGLRVGNDAWVPTFVPYVSVAAAIVLMYGCDFRTIVTGAIFGAIFTTPITMFLRYEICLPLKLPGVIASVSGMWIGGIIVFELCNSLPWMHKEVVSDLQESQVDDEVAVTINPDKNTSSFFIRRILADYSEPMFVGNEIAGLCLIVGSILTWILSPMQPYYGTGWFPALILCQLLTGSISVFVYWEKWMESDFYPTFVPVVSVAPAMVLQYGPSMPIIIISAILGALVCPPIAEYVNSKIPPHWHGMIGFTFSMAFVSFGVNELIRYLSMVLPLI